MGAKKTEGKEELNNVHKDAASELGLENHWKEQKVRKTREEWGDLITKRIQEP